MTLSLVTRPCARSRWGQIANSSGADRAKIDVAGLRGDRGEASIRLDQRGDATGRCPARNHLRALRTQTARADRRSQPCGSPGSEQRLGLEIVEQQPLREPVRRAASGPSITQGALVSLSVRPSTGPRRRQSPNAAARRASRRPPRSPRRAPEISGPAMDDRAERPPGSLTSANRTLVPPVSQTRTGKGRQTRSLDL